MNGRNSGWKSICLLWIIIIRIQTKANHWRKMQFFFLVIEIDMWIQNEIIYVCIDFRGHFDWSIIKIDNLQFKNKKTNLEEFFIPVIMKWKSYFQRWIRNFNSIKIYTDMKKFKFKTYNKPNFKFKINVNYSIRLNIKGFKLNM